MKRILLAFFCLTTSLSNAQVIINEFSNGPSGSQEFYELAVVGPPGTFVDIRGWILDDHSGYFGCAGGNGIASGHLRFANHTNWQCVPTGSLIVIYNPVEINSSITQSNDYTDANGDGVYILNISASPYLEADISSPTSTACNTFGTSYAAPLNWSCIALGNSADAAEIVDPTNTTTAYHAIGYGSLNGPLPTIYFSGNGGGKNYSFTNTTSNDWNLLANWTSASASTNDTPGLPNNTANANWLDSLKLNASSDVSQGCSPLTVNFQCNSNASGYTYSWDFDDGNTGSGAITSHTYNSTGTFSAVLTVTSPLGCSVTDTVDITVSTGGTVIAPALSDICESLNTYALPNGTPIGGTWSGTGVSNNVFSPSTVGSGTYTLTYSTTGNCPGSDQTTITVVPSPNVTFTPSNTSFCVDDNAVTLSSGFPTGGVYFGAGISGSTFTPSVAQQGSHTIGYTYSNNGCADTAYATFNVDSLPAITWNLPDTVCEDAGQITVATAQPTGGDYFLNGNTLTTTTIDVSNYPAATTLQLSYTTTNNTCSATENNAIYISPIPNVQFTPTTTSFCQNQATIPLTGGSPTGGTYFGSGVSGNNFAPSSLAPGTYSVGYSYTTGGCADTAYATFTINAAPTISWNLPDTICDDDGAVFIGGATPIAGNYYANGTLLPNDSLYPHNYSTNTSIQVEYSVAQNGCSSSTTETIYLTTSPSITITASNDTILCEQEVIALTANGFGNYTWSTGDHTNSISPTQTNTYWVEAQNKCGIDSDTQTVTFITTPSLSLNKQEATICPGDTAVFIATSNLSPIVWSNGDTGNSITIDQAGQYSVEVSNACGMVQEDFHVYSDNPSVEIDASVFVDNNYSFGAFPSNFSFYDWTINTSNVSSTAYFNYSFTDEGEYWVELTATTENGCIATDSLLLTIESEITGLFIPNAFTPNGDLLNDQFIIVGVQPSKFHAAVFNRWGEEIKAWTIISEPWDGTQNGIECPEGVYVLRVVYDEETIIKSITLVR